jgi:hypothetical protein
MIVALPAAVKGKNTSACIAFGCTPVRHEAAAFLAT